MILLVGLGNPGQEYKWTRHNAGFLAVEKIVETQGGDWRTETKNEAIVAKIKIGSTDVIAAKPLTFMNLSGNAVSKLMHYYKISPDDVIIFSDDINLEWGKARVRTGGQDGGHNGLRSIILSIGENFTRVRIGVGYNETIPAEDYVLKQLTQPEKEMMVKQIDNLISNMIDWIIGNVAHGTNIPEQTANII